MIDHLLNNITERKYAEEELAKNRTMLIKAQELGHMGSWEWDMLTNELSWSKEVYSIYGLDPGINMPKYELVINTLAPECRNDFLKAIEDALEGRKPFDGEYSIILPDGTRSYTHTKGEVVFSEGHPVKMYGMVQDITQRKMVEEQIRYQAALLANVNDAIVASDENYKLMAWNTAAESLYGWKAEEVLGRPGIELLQTDYGSIDKDEMLRKITAAGKWRGEVTQVRKDGVRIPVEVSSIVLHDENDRIVGYVSVNHDITERKQVEEELRKYRDHLEELVKERTAELKRKNEELERFNKLFVGRELRMIELKKIISEYKEKNSELEKEIGDLKKKVTQ